MIIEENVPLSGKRKLMLTCFRYPHLLIYLVAYTYLITSIALHAFRSIIGVIVA